MNIAKSHIITLGVVITAFLFTAEFTVAETRYISDILVVSLRNGPALSYTALRALKTGESFEVLDEQNKFIKVKTSQGLEGWLPKQYTMSSRPNLLLAKSLKEQIYQLKKENEQLVKIKEDLSHQLSSNGENILKLKHEMTSKKSTDQTEIERLTQELDEINQKYSQFVADNNGSINIKKNLNKLTVDYKNSQEKLKALEEEVSRLNNRTALYWFLAGGGVFFFGWLAARLSVRRHKSLLTL